MILEELCIEFILIQFRFACITLAIKCEDCSRHVTMENIFGDISSQHLDVQSISL